MNYKALSYSTIVIFILFVAIICYSTYTWQRLIEQGDFLQIQENKLTKKIAIIERNEQTSTVEAHTEIVNAPLSAEQKLDLKKLQSQYEDVKLQSLKNKGSSDLVKRDLLVKQINELWKQIRTLERNKQTITVEEQAVTSFYIPLSTKQQLEIVKLRDQRDELHQSLIDTGRWDPDKRKRISLSRFGDSAMWIILPYFIFLIPILLSLLWKQLARKKVFISSCVAACYSTLPIYFYFVIYPVRSHEYAYIVVAEIAAFSFILGIITLVISYIALKRVQKSNS